MSAPAPGGFGGMGPSGSGPTGSPPHGGGGSGLSPFHGTPPPHPPMPAIPTPPLGAGALMHAAPLPDAPIGAGAAFVPQVAAPAAPARNAVGLRPGLDDALIEMREHSALAPHSGALFQNQHRSADKPAKGYPSQAPAHQALGASALDFAGRAAAAAPPGTLATAVHMASSQLHVSLPGPELRDSLGDDGHGDWRGHGFPALALPGSNGNLKTPAAVDALVTDIHERREHAKANVVEAAAQLSPMSRAQVALPSPRRESMAHGGGYIDPPPLAPPPAALPADVPAQRQMARSLLTPLAEPEWTAPARAQGVAAMPQQGADVNQARAGFMLQAGHAGEVGRDATAKYLGGDTPEKSEVRVNAVPSATLHPGTGAGAHEVVPTELRHDIAAMPGHIRPQMAHAQADLRTSTALTFLRGGPAGGGAPAAAPAAAPAPAPMPALPPALPPALLPALAPAPMPAPAPAPAAASKGVKRKKPGT